MARSNDPIPGAAALPPSCPLRSCQRLPGLTLLLGTGTKPRLRPSWGCRAELGARFSRAPPAPARRRPSPPPGRRAGRARATAAGAASPVGAAGDTGGSWLRGAGPVPGSSPVGRGRGSDAASLGRSHDGVPQRGFCSPLFSSYLQQGHAGTDTVGGGIRPLPPAEILRLRPALAHFTSTLPLVPSGTGRFQRQPSSGKVQRD